MTLTEMANKYGTDKGTTVGAAHGYSEIYQRYLEPMRETATRILEIGIAGGNSLWMWRDYFPYAQIFGIDHNRHFVDAMFNKDPLIQAEFGEATDPAFWQRFGELWGHQWDFICDDGGHFSSQIIPTWNGAWPLLRHGGIYAIEDTHQIFLQEKSYDLTAFKYFASVVESRLHESGHNQCGKPDIGDIEWFHQYKSLLLFRKR